MNEQTEMHYRYLLERVLKECGLAINGFIGIGLNRTGDICGSCQAVWDIGTEPQHKPNCLYVEIMQALGKK